MYNYQLLRITVIENGQLLFLGWVEENKTQEIVKTYERSHPSSLKVEIVKEEINED